MTMLCYWQEGNPYLAELQTLLHESVEAECRSKGLNGCKTGHAKAQTALEQGQFAVQKWLVALAQAEEGSYNKCLAKVSLNKAESKLQALQQQAAKAAADLQHVLDVRDKMLKDLDTWGGI